MRAHTELDRLATARPPILQRTEEVVDAAGEERILHQILTTAAPARGGAGAAGGAPARRRRTRLLAGSAGLTAAAVAAAVMLVTGMPAGPAGPAAAGRQGPARLSARQILLAAATSAAASPAASGTYWQVRKTWSQPGYQETDEIWRPRGGSPEWIRAGKKTGGRLIKIPVPPGFLLAGDPAILSQLANSPAKPRLVKVPPAPPGSVLPGQVTFGQLQNLPAAPAALKAWITSFNRHYQRWAGLPGQGHVADFLSLTSLVAALPAPPAVRAAAFRALATLPGVTTVGRVGGGQALRLSLGGAHYATLVVNTATSQARDILTVSGPEGQTGSMSVTAHWVNRLP